MLDTNNAYALVAVAIAVMFLLPLFSINHLFESIRLWNSPTHIHPSNVDFHKTFLRMRNVIITLRKYILLNDMSININ